MSTEDRILRLENAMSTLLELAAEQQRLAAEQQRQSAEQQRRTARLEESLVVLIELSRSHNESIDELRAGQIELRAAQTESEQKIAALVDAQIRTEEARAEFERKLAALVDAHARTEDALARLTERVNDILQNGRNGQPPS
jgi:chromosome segregation ATPase